MRFLTLALNRLTDFSGRDPRRLFWPYAGVVVLAMIMLMGMVNMAFMSRMMLRADASAMPDFSGMVLAMAIEILAIVALLAAAVTRRLHDTGRAGYWGLAPVPFLAFGMGGFYALTRTFVDGTQDIPPLFVAIFFNNMIYMASIVLLVVLLCQPTKPAANRYGEPPAA